MKNIKYILGTLLVSCSLLKGASTSMVVASGNMTNLLSVINGSARVTQIVVASIPTNSATVMFIDTPTNSLTYSNASYQTLSSYGTNLIQSWTNFFGVVNYLTNIALIDYTNTVAGSTNPYPVRQVVTVGTNTTIQLNPVSIYFNQGIWLTNGGTGPAQVSITYQQ